MRRLTRLPIALALIASTLAVPAAAAAETTPTTPVGVVLVDTGVADLSGLERVVTRLDVTGGDGSDQIGHGTALADLIVRNSTSSVIHSVRVDDGTADGASLPGLLAGLRTAWWLGKRGAADVVVLAGGIELSEGHTDILEAAVDRLTRSGMTVVVAAGNEELRSPATANSALAVGAYDHAGTPETTDDTSVAWSPTGVGDDGAPRPTLLAPGVSLPTRILPGSVIDGTRPEGSSPDGTVTGTSAAAALAGAAAADLLATNPDLTPADVRDLLISSRTLDGRPVLADVDRSTLSAPSASQLSEAAINSGPINAAWAKASRNFDPNADGGMAWDGFVWKGFHWTGFHWTGFHWTGFHWS